LIVALGIFGLSPVLSVETPIEHPGWRVINIVVFVAVLAYLFINKIKIGQILEKRASAIHRDLEEARREKEEAEQRLAQIAARLSRLDQELVDIKAQAEVEAQREAERIRQAAAADAEKIQQLAKREIEGAMKAARAELRAFVADHSVGMAEAMIRQDIKPEDNSRMLSQYVDELGGVNR
jgi:F-type H+-transporting ATPase subunit b